MSLAPPNSPIVRQTRLEPAGKLAAHGLRAFARALNLAVVAVALGTFLTLSAGAAEPAARPAPPPDPLAWKAGVATIDITPDGPVWMAGFAFRNKQSEGVAQHLFAKALALQDMTGRKMVLVTMDFIAVPKQLRTEVEREVGNRFGVPPEFLLLNASHTHSGPVPYSRGGVFAPKGDEPTAFATLLRDKIITIVGDALARLEPAILHYTHARAGFAMNRRARIRGELQMNPNPDGPVDHDVPVLRVVAPDGKLKVLLFGYACHNTVTNFYQINGDYAGFAQAHLQEAHPGTVAMFMMGAGGDQNAYPRFVSIEQAVQHGRTLAYAVDAALMVASQRQLAGPLRTALGFIELDYSDISRMDLERRARSLDDAEKSRADKLLAELDAKGELPRSYPCPVQVIRFGREMTLIAIGGETTVEYSLRLKREIGNTYGALWVAGYSNDVFGYLGSRQVILEGGYEGYTANLGRHPGPWAVDTEERVIRKAYELLRATNH